MESKNGWRGEGDGGSIELESNWTGDSIYQVSYLDDILGRNLYNSGVVKF